jgi:tripartite-type tricarboxylate transporter receptor subunit TctC
VVKAWSDRDVHQRLVASGQDPVSSTPEQLGELVRSGLAQWTPIIRQLGIRTD